MSFIKERTIYESETVRIYVNECHSKGRKTRIFCVRRDDTTGLAALIGTIEFSGRWRQYVFMPGKNTQWSAGCLNNIVSFVQVINKKWRKSLKKR